MGVHRSTYYRWKAQVERHGLGDAQAAGAAATADAQPALGADRAEDRGVRARPPRPGSAADRVAAGPPEWGGLLVSPNGVYKTLSGTGSTRAPSGWRWSPAIARPSSRRATPRRSRTSTQAGRASWSASTASSSAGCTAPRARSGRSPRSTPTAATPGPIWSPPRQGPDRRADLRARPPRRRRAPTAPAGSSNACSPTTAPSSAAASSAPGCPPGRHTQIRSGRPQTNGHVERLHRTILEECWRPGFARYLQVRFSGLKRDLAHYLHDYNHDREHHGRITAGRRPADLVYGARKMEPR